MGDVFRASAAILAFDRKSHCMRLVAGHQIVLMDRYGTALEVDWRAFNVEEGWLEVWVTKSNRLEIVRTKVKGLQFAVAPEVAERKALE